MIRTLLIWMCLMAGWSADETFNRRVLALYDSTEANTNTAENCNIHRTLEAPLNHLGLVVDYADVARRPLPDPRGYRAVVIWFGDDVMEQPDDYAQWQLTAMSNGVRLVCMNGLGMTRDAQGEPVDALVTDPVLEAWGLRSDKAFAAVDNPAFTRCDDLRPERFSCEVKDAVAPGIYTGRLVPMTSDVQIWRSLRCADRLGSDSAAVAVGPLGGYCSSSDYALRTISEPIFLARWDLDPYAFLVAALGLSGAPRLDTTTAWGRRIGFSTIDGDGLLNGAQDLPGPPRLAGAVVRDEVLSRLSIPVTVSFIMGELENAGTDEVEAIALARSIAALPHVQLGSHGYTHPLDWTSGKLGVPVPGFTYDPVAEVTTAVEHANRLVAAPDQHVEIFLWTGNCQPPASALSACARLGIEELNGGDSRFDREYPSLSGIAPLTRWIDGQRQTYAAASNENLYTELWTENFGGFSKVIETFQRSGEPRRLAPVHIYYHWYSGERQAAVRALNEVYGWSLQQRLCWITAAEYVRRVQGFSAARLGTCDGGWWIEHAGCPTVRFDDEPRGIDVGRSRGVLGAVREGTTWYCSLDPDVPRAEIRFAALAAHAPHPYLESSTAPLRRVATTSHGWRAQARCFAAGAITLKGFSAASTVSTACGGLSLDLKADQQGAIVVPLPPGRGTWIEVACGF